MEIGPGEVIQQVSYIFAVCLSLFHAATWPFLCHHATNLCYCCFNMLVAEKRTFTRTKAAELTPP